MEVQGPQTDFSETVAGGGEVPNYLTLSRIKELIPYSALFDIILVKDGGQL